MEKNNKFLLNGYRALDLTDEKGAFGGRLLADMGADVIKVERPGGDLCRNIGPFYDDIPDPEKSLCWFAYNANKRGITLNIETSSGQKIFEKMVESCDIVLESFPPGYMDRQGLGYEDLSHINPKLIMTSITPFGQSGPYRDYETSDIISMAMGGFMYMCGDSDRPPCRATFPQSFLNAGAEAAVGSLTALYYRGITEEGQWVDVSIQESVIPTLVNFPSFWSFNKVFLRRAGPFRVGVFMKSPVRNIYPCKDGYVAFSLLAGQIAASMNYRLIEWLDSEGLADDFIKTIKWEKFDMARVTPEESGKIERYYLRLFQRHTKDELHQGAIERGIMLYPVSHVGDIRANVQLKSRDFWEEVEHPEKKQADGNPPLCSAGPGKNGE